MARSPVLVVLGASAVMLAACGGDGSDGPPRARTSTPTAVSTPAPDDAEPRSRAPDPTAARGGATYCVGSFQRISERPAVAAFNAAHRGDGLHARFRRLPGAGSPRHERLVRLLGHGCDVAHVDMTSLADFAYAGLVSNVTDYLRARQSEFMRGPLDAVRWNGKYWGVPRSVDAGLLYYHKVGSGPPKTWQELYERARDNDGLVYQGDAYESLTVHFLELAYSAGATVLSADGQHSELNSPESLRALELMVEGIDDGAVRPDMLRYREEDARLAFADGRATYMRNWPYAIALRRGEVEKFDSVALSRAIYRNVHAALTGRLSPEEALRRADQQIERALADVRVARGDTS